MVASAQPLTAPATESDAFVVATSAEQVIGTWCVGNDCLRFDGDGTYRAAVGKDRLEHGPQDISACRFEDGVMVVAEFACWSTVPCREMVGRYEVRLLEGGNPRIADIDPIRGGAVPRAAPLSSSRSAERV